MVGWADGDMRASGLHFASATPSAQYTAYQKTRGCPRIRRAENVPRPGIAIGADCDQQFLALVVARAMRACATPE